MKRSDESHTLVLGALVHKILQPHNFPSTSIIHLLQNPKILIAAVDGQSRSPLWLLSLCLLICRRTAGNRSRSPPALSPRRPLACRRSGAHYLAESPVAAHCSWKPVISMPAGEEQETPHSLKSAEDLTLDQVTSNTDFYSNSVLLNDQETHAFRVLIVLRQCSLQTIIMSSVSCDCSDTCVTNCL
ncbi:uncharacterized protein LOC115996079 [Ipomoea triloba]|uniref:uncharacterized protein LOC115996079 n=1 Tax=Ipomoea triloba TaxID=35885 RepID=UPI00125D4398|nr:uncharacterized protein LOC115996079 [Ipomoea triloba]